MEVIRVENLSKLYDLGQVGTGTLSKDLNRWWARVRGKQDPYARVGQTNDRTRKGAKDDSVWALKDINFSVNQGDVLGIIGRNGAGKSTLLKIISRITTPTTGAVKVRGRIASLLEVGTGFHPEMTGRENIFMNGTLLGMTRKEIQRKLDEIIDFAGVALYIDTPVKRYSSGMQVRLAFAVGAFLEPEILIVDEVLAVGDADFQRKAIGKMKNVSQAEGRTVLFVSHNMGAVSSLTKRCIFMHEGGLKFYDDTPEVIRKYFDFSIEKASKNKANDIDYFRKGSAKESPVFIRDIIINESDSSGIHLGMFEAIFIKIKLEVLRAITGANLTVVLKNSQGDKVAILFSWDKNVYLHLDAGIHYVQVSFENNLSPDNYYIDVGINQATGTAAYDIIGDFFICSVKNNGQIMQWQERPWGMVHFNNVKWNLVDK